LDAKLNKILKDKDNKALFREKEIVGLSESEDEQDSDDSGGNDEIRLQKGKEENEGDQERIVDFDTLLNILFCFSR